MDYQQVIDFWFAETDPEKWWREDAAFDRQILEKFARVQEQAARCELYAWRATSLGRLAEIIVLDQFSRNMFRNTPRAFATDSLALALAQEAVAAKTQASLETRQRAFLYLPFMHSESQLIHEIAVTLFAEEGLEANLKFEYRHKAIIDRFGRYPHRNAILGRASSAEETEFLKTPGSSF